MKQTATESVKQLKQHKIPFFAPSIGEEEIASVVETLRSGWITTGPKVKQFESRFAERVGAKHAIAVNSGTSALHLALEAVGVSPGDEVIVPTLTFTATAEVAIHLGATPVLVDSTLISDTVKTLAYPNSISAATSPSGRIFVVYYKTNSGELRFATKEAGTSWTDSLITTASASVTAMAFDTGGNPNICFVTDSDIKYARFTGSAWDVQTITAEATDYVSITVSNTDIPHVSFYAKGQWDLKYSTIVGSTWETQPVESDGLSGKSCSISLDPSGQPHIVYIKSNTYELKHAWWTGATWETEVIDSGDYASSVMGNFGKPTIAYISLLQELKFAEYR